MRLLITGTNSGCGKTTVTCALLAAFKARGIGPTAYKCGPDYIDPMFHRAASGVRAYNLDPFFLDGEGLRRNLTGGLSVIEGAMGFYDGIAASEEASAYTVARETDTPAVLVVSAKGAGSSVEAVIEGFVRHRADSHIRGVIFNDANEKRYPDLKRFALNAGVTPYGFLPRDGRWTLPGRHLGLLTADEIGDLKNILRELGNQAERTLDIDGLLALAAAASNLDASLQIKSAQMKTGGSSPGEPGGVEISPAFAAFPNAEALPTVSPNSKIFLTALPETENLPVVSSSPKLSLAVSRDEAFCFIYEENLELLRSLGCEIIFFSPLRDKSLPPNISGLLLCGGYPELHLRALSENKSMLESIRRAAENGLPTIAEGGGFLYLHKTLDGVHMCGVINGSAFKTDGLKRFGYITLTAAKNNLLCKSGESIRSREFHYWDSDSPGDGFLAKKAGRDISYQCVHATDSMYAGFPHLYFPANPLFAKNFTQRMKQYEP